MVVIIKFKSEPRIGKPPVDWVLLAPPGESRQSTQTWHRTSKLVPPESPTEVEARSDSYLAMKARWERIGPAYEAWKAGQEIPETGIPLGAWSGVSQEQAEILKSFAVRTIEDVAELGDGLLQRIPISDIRRLKVIAGEYLEARPMTDMQEELAAAKERMAAMEEMLAEATKPKPEAPKKAESKKAAA